MVNSKLKEFKDKTEENLKTIKKEQLEIKIKKLIDDFFKYNSFNLSENSTGLDTFILGSITDILLSARYHLKHTFHWCLKRKKTFISWEFGMYLGMLQHGSQLWFEIPI